MKEEPITTAETFRAYRGGWKAGFECGKKAAMAEIRAFDNIADETMLGPLQGWNEYLKNSAANDTDEKTK